MQHSRGRKIKSPQGRTSGEEIKLIQFFESSIEKAKPENSKAKSEERETFKAFESSPMKRKINHQKTSSCQLEGSPEIDKWVDNSLNEYHKFANLKTLSEKKLSRIQSPGTFLVQKAFEASVNNMNSKKTFDLPQNEIKQNNINHLRESFFFNNLKNKGLDKSPEVNHRQDNLGRNSIHLDSSYFWKFNQKEILWQKPTKYESSSLVFENPFLNQALGSPNASNPKIQNFLETSKIKTPQNHRLLKVARVKNDEEQEQEKTPDAKNRLSLNFSQTKGKKSKPSFNSSLEYIQKLRAATPSNSESHFGHSLALMKQEDLDKLHISQSTTLSKSATPLHFSQEKTTDIAVLEKLPLPTFAEFLTLSDANKKLFFAQIYNTQKQNFIKYASQKKLKSMAWKNYEAVRTREDFKNLYILIIDLNKFDHVRHQLSSSIDPQNILEIFGNFKTQSNSNLILFMMYYETQFEEKIEIFNRIIVDEKDENEFDTLVWRNIYRYQLHQIVFANPTLYPKSDKFDDLKKAVEEIMKNKKSFILPILHHLQKLENNPLMIERNGQVYNFDVHSYIQEYSSQYTNLLKKSFRNSPPHENLLYRTSSEEKTTYVKIRPKSSNITRTPKNHFSIDHQSHHSKEAISILNGDALNNTAEKNQISPQNQEDPAHSGLGRFQTYLNHVVQGNSSKINKKGSHRSLKHGMMIEGTRIGMEDKTGLSQIRKSFTPKNSLISSSFASFDKSSKTKTPKN